MTTSLYSFVDIYARALDTLDHVLTRAEAHAAEQGLDAASMLDWRLIEDMHPLRFQIRTVVNFAQTWAAVGAGVEAPAQIEEDLDLAGFHAAIAAAKAFLSTLTAEQFAGRDALEYGHTLGNGTTLTLPVESWLKVFGLTNVHFHMSTAYGILRARGVPLGKLDLFSTGL